MKKYLSEYLNEMMKIGFNCNPIDKEKTKYIITKFYRLQSIKKPVFYFCNGFLDSERSYKFKKDTLYFIVNNVKTALDFFINNSKYYIIHDEYMDLIYHFLLQKFSVFTDILNRFLFAAGGWGQFDIYWIAFYKFFEYLGIKYNKHDLELLNDYYELAKSCMWYFPYKDYCIVADRPVKLNFDFNSNELHNYEKPVIQFRDGYNFYYIHGVKVENRLVENPMSITIDEIEKESNIELRRIKIQIYDYHRKQGSFIKNSGSILIDDCNSGKLYKKYIWNDEPIVMVNVKNSTINKDGSIDEYFIRVPPNITKVKQAIAWTFNMNENEYKPIIQS